MSTENTHDSTVKIQDSTRLFVEDSIVQVMEPQIPLNLKSVPVGLAMYLCEKLDAKIVDKHKAWHTAA